MFMPCANNKGADQPAHLRNLNSTFIVCCLDSMIPLVSISEIASFYLASVAVQASLCLTCSQTPKTGFLVTWLIWQLTFKCFTDWSILLFDCPKEYLDVCFFNII